MLKHVRDAWPVILIVGTIAGAAWTAAWNVRGFLTTQIEASETRLTAQTERSEARLTAQIERSEARLTAQIADLTTQVAEIRQYIVEHLRDHGDPE